MTESFAQLFEESLKGLETRQGAVVKGAIVAIQKGYVLVDTGSKSESAIPAEVVIMQHELAEKQPLLMPHLPLLAYELNG